MTTTAATAENQEKTIQKKVESTAADEQKHRQDCWKQFFETNSKTSQAYGEHS